MASTVIHEDLELYLTTAFREFLRGRDEPFARSVEVVQTEPDPKKKFPDRLLIVRVDGGTNTSVVTREVDVGLSVLAGSKAAPKDANDLIELVLAFVQTLPTGKPGNPIAAVMSTAGPFKADENQERARRYGTVTFSVVGRPFI